jgi:hypothetical protein
LAKEVFKMKKILFLCSIGLFTSNLMSQNVSINNDGSVADPSAILDVKSTRQGLLIPRMEESQRVAIHLPVYQLVEVLEEEVVLHVFGLGQVP